MLGFSEIGEIFTLIGIFLSAAIFLRLALKGRSLGSFRFQLSIFILIWTGAELPNAAATLGIIPDTTYALEGLFLHMLSMAAFAVFVGIKSFAYFKPRPLPSPPAIAPLKPSGPMERPEL